MTIIYCPKCGEAIEVTVGYKKPKPSEALAAPVKPKSQVETITIKPGKPTWVNCPKCDGWIPKEWKRHDKCGWNVQVEESKNS